MDTTEDTLDDFFATQRTRICMQLGLTGRNRFYGRGTNPATMEGTPEQIIERAYTRVETVPIPYRKGRNQRGF